MRLPRPIAQWKSVTNTGSADRRGRAAGIALAGSTALALLAFSDPAAAKLDKFQIRILGEDHEIGNAVLAASQVATVRDQEDLEPGDLLAAAQADYARILGALYGLGHYSGVVHVLIDGREAASIAPISPPSRIDSVVITVDPGPEFTFARAKAAPLAPETELPEGFARGKRAESGLIVDAASAGVDGWRAAGHAKAAVTGQQVIADHRRDTLDAEIDFTPGPKVTFGSLSISGQRRVSQERIRKIAGFPTGEPFDPDKVDDVAERLRRTGTFRSVVLTEAETVGPDGRLDYDLVVGEQKRRRMSFGAEYSTDDGATLTAGWMHRNLFGGAEKLTIDGTISGIGGASLGTSSTSGSEDYDLTTRLERPGTPYADSTAFIEGNLSRDQQEDYTSDNAGLTFGLTRYISDRLTAELGLGYEASKVKDDTGERTSYQQMVLPFSLTWDDRNNALNATEGFYAKGEIMPFYGIETTGNGARLAFDTRAYHGFGKDDRIVLAGRLQGGGIYGTDIEHSPRNYLFFSGGGGTVRGQPYESLGVYEIDPDVKTGGTQFAAASLELRGAVTKSISLVAFYDAGWVSGDDSSASHAGAGLGIRYNTSIGPIRFDVANPVSGDTGDGLQFYIGIGQAF